MSRKNKIFVTLSVCFTLLNGVVLTAGQYLPNGIAAIVEDRVVTYEQIRMEMAPLMPGISNLPQDKLREKISSISKDILQNLVDRILIVKQFEEDGMIIPKSYVETRYDDVITKDFGGDRAQFLGYLKRNNRTVRQFRKELEEKVIVQSMRSRMQRTQAEISPEKIEKYYRENKVAFFQEDKIFLQQILLSPYAEETADLLLQEGARIISELKKGIPFGDLAQKYSKDEMRNNDGEWGWIKRNEIRKELEDRAFELDPGEFTIPLLVDKNVFILRVKEKKVKGVKPLDDVRDEIENKLSEKIAQDAQKRWIERLRQKAYIRYF